MDKIYIKNMVCNRCKMAVEKELDQLGVHALSVELGEVTLDTALSPQKRSDLEKQLQHLGFELIDDKKSRLIENIKKHIIELVHHHNSDLKVNLSDYLGEKLGNDYKYLSNLFSEVEGITVEKYFIAQKIEKVKELLVYDEMTLSEIASQLNYSSVAHLSNQFKKVTGFTPSHFKNIKEDKRKPLDMV